MELGNNNLVSSADFATDRSHTHNMHKTKELVHIMNIMLIHYMYATCVYCIIRTAGT
jgi:hypothetical protein